MDKESKLKELRERLEVINEEYKKVFDNLPPGLDYFQVQDQLEYSSRRCGEIDTQIRMLMEPEFGPIPEYGDVMSLKEFIDCCNSGRFIDYDGSGNYARGNEMSDITIYPSDVKAGKIRKDFDKVVWFNR